MRKRKPSPLPYCAGSTNRSTSTPPAGSVNVEEKLIIGDGFFAGKDYRAALFAYQDAILADPRNVAARVKAMPLLEISK